MVGQSSKRSVSETQESPIVKAPKLSAPNAKLTDVVQDVIRYQLAGLTHKPSSTGFLTAKGQEQLGQSSKSMFFATALSRDAIILRKFLFCIAHGDQDRAEKLLKLGNPSKWLLRAGEFTDYSGRTFRCTAYEYAYWAKDTHMCRMLVKYMDEATKASMLQRVEAMERIDETTGRAQGLTYQQHHRTYCSAHYDFTPLIQALQIYVLGYRERDEAEDRHAMRASWNALGKAQRDVPAHVAQEYCRPNRPFYPCPTFKEQNFPRMLTFFNHAHGFHDQTWFPLDNPYFLVGGPVRGCKPRLIKSEECHLGSDFAFLRGDHPGLTECGFHRAGGYYGHLDLPAITRLDKVRTAELVELRESLKPLASSQCQCVAI